MKAVTEFFRLAESRYWTTSLLPAVVGSVLPFWLHPPGFTFQFESAVLFLVAALLCHIGFALLLSYFRKKNTEFWSRTRLLWTAIVVLLISGLIGLIINHQIHVGKHVYKNIFIVYGIAVYATGLLYVVPPFRFHRRAGGETVLSVGVGMIPVLGAYIVQVGDLTRTVYLASLPLVLVTGLWVWVTELYHRVGREQSTDSTMADLFPILVSGKLTTFILFLYYFSFLVAVFGRKALNPWSLLIFLSLIIAYKIVSTTWKTPENQEKITASLKIVMMLHLLTNIFIAVTSLLGS